MQTTYYIVKSELVCNPETGETIPKLTVWGTFIDPGKLRRFVQYMVDSCIDKWYTDFEIVTFTETLHGNEKHTIPMIDFINEQHLRKRTFKERMNDNA